MGALPGEYGGDVYGGGLYGGGVPVWPNAIFRLNLDQDPLILGGVITGDDSTCESLGAWTAGPDTDLTLNTAVSRVYAGLACLRLEATADADISVSLPDQGTVTAGRTYLVWAHSLPEDTARTVQLALTWRSATGIELTSKSASREQVTTGHVRVGILATAPPAAATVDVTVTVLGALDGEVHYVDTVTLDDVGIDITPDVLSGSCTGSGRNHELDRTDAGSLSLTLSNERGYWTPGGVTDINGDPIPAPYLGNIVPRRRVWVLAEWMGVLYAVWSGHVRSWTQSIPGGQAAASEVVLQANDGFRWLSGADVPPPYRAQVLGDGPLSLFPLDEPSASAVAGDLVFGKPARILSSGSGDGTSAFGAATVLPVTLTGSNTDGNSTSLGLNLAQDSLADLGSVLDLRFAGGMPPQLFLDPWALEFWFAYGGPIAPPAVAQILFRHIVSSGGVDFLSGFQVLLTDTGAVQVTTGGSETVATSGVGMADGVGHHVVLTYEDDGSTYGLATLYVDGSEVGSLQLTTQPMPAGTPQIAQLGGALSTLGREPSFMAQCRFQHIAFYYQRLTDDQVLSHFLAGATGFYQETDGDRVTAALRFTGWPDEDTSIDAGLTPLLPRGWAATNGLALIQDVCSYSGATPVVDPRGSVRVLNRHRFVNEVRIRAHFRASENTEAEANNFAPGIDDSGIANIVEVQQIGGGTIQVTDPDSIEHFGRIKGDAIPLGAANDAESLTHAQWLLTRTAEPLVRVQTSQWLPPTSPDLWPLVLDIQFGDRVQLHELPATAPVDPLDVLIGRVSHEWPGAGQWVTTYQLEPALIDEMGVFDADSDYGTYDTDLMVYGY